MTNARADNPGAPTVERADQAQPTNDGQETLEDDRASLVRAAREQGERGACLAAPDGFDRAIAAVRNAAAEFGSFSADDVVFPGPRTTLGTAFSTLRRSGEIEVCGYGVSRRPVAHGRLVRVCRAT